MRARKLRQRVVTLPLRAIADIIHWNIRGIKSNIEELQLCKQYKPQVVAVQECNYEKMKLFI